jgi:hypothetical protein
VAPQNYCGSSGGRKSLHFSPLVPASGAGSPPQLKHSSLSMKTALFSLVTLLFATATGSAALTEWRTEVQASISPPGGNLTFANQGGLNDASSSVTLSNSGVLSEASSQLNASGYIPTLRTRVTQTSGHGQAVAWGVQGYTNTLATPLSTSLIMHLTGTITGNNDNDLQARIYLFETENFEYFGDPGTILFESSSQLWPGFETFANNAGPNGFDVFASGAGTVDEMRTFDFTVDPGDSFYVWARLVATADTPGVVDAFSTLTATLSETEGFEPAFVPEPSSAMLLILGALGLYLRRRRVG